MVDYFFVVGKIFGVDIDDIADKGDICRFIDDELTVYPGVKSYFEGEGHGFVI